MAGKQNRRLGALGGVSTENGKVIELGPEFHLLQRCAGEIGEYFL